MSGVPLFSASNLPVEGWREYRKTALARAVYIDGPFRVETSETENEPFFCEDGYLAVDSRGYPYAIAADEFDAIYVPASDPEARPASESSTVELIGLVEDGIELARRRVGQSPAGREFSLAITALEDAQMRFTRGLAREKGVFRPVDLERVDGPSERARFEEEARAAAPTEEIPVAAVERAVISVSDWPCPPHWAGLTRELEDGRVVFACGACPNPGDCADAGSCERAEGCMILRRQPGGAGSSL